MLNTVPPKRKTLFTLTFFEELAEKQFKLILKKHLNNNNDFE